MENQKTCCLYISTFHLFTIILPYIDEQIKAGKKIELLVQKDLSSDLKMYFEKVRGLKVDKNKILNLEWNSKSEISEYSEEKTIVIIGDEKFISYNERIIIENSLENHILSCYKMNNSLEISTVLLNHDELLTTKRIRKISKFSQNEQKTSTISSQL